MNTAIFDREMMANALTIARRGLGQTAPNPAVGAVIADGTTGEVIARGWTQAGGRPHAETEALRLKQWRLDLPAPRLYETHLHNMYGDSWRKEVPWKVKCYTGGV